MGEPTRIPASPYAWPHDGDLTPGATALVIVDMQRDFCHPGGYVAAMGYDIAPAARIVPVIAGLLAQVRAWGATIVYTREGHRPDLSDVSPLKHWRSRRAGAEIGRAGPLGRLLVRGEAGWEIVPELTPRAGELLIDKIGYSAFHGTDLDPLLRQRGIQKLMLAGVTTDVCVHSTLRDAVDRGYECLLIGDACAATNDTNHAAALDTVTREGGIFGAVARSADCVFT